MKDTITPLNYTKEAIKDLSVMEKGLRSNAPLTSYIMRQVIDMLDQKNTARHISIWHDYHIQL